MPRTARILAAAAIAAVTLGKAAADDPYLVVSVKSVDELFGDARRITGGDAGKQDSPLDGIVLQLTGGKGLVGIDRSKPFGACLDLGAAGVPEVTLLVPVKDSKSFFAFLGVPPEAAAGAENRTFHVAVFGRELYTKLSRGYAYVATGASQLDRLPSASCLSSSRFDVGLTLNFSRVPAAQRKSMADMLVSRLEEARSLGSGMGGRSASYGRGYEVGNELTVNSIERVILEAERFSLGINLEGSSGLFVVDWELVARPGTSLAASLNGYGAKTPSFSGIFSNDAAVSGFWSVPIPDELRTAFGAEMAMSAKEAHAGFDSSKVYANAVDRKNAHESVESFFNAFDGLDTLDLGCVLDPAPGGKLQFVAAFKVTRGEDIATTIERLSKLPAGAMEEGELKLDVAKHAGARIHSMKLAPDGAKLVAGGTLFFAVRGDSVFMAAGSDGLGLVKSALDKTSGSPSRKPPISFRVRPSKLIDLYAARGGGPDVERARQAFAAGGDYASFEMLSVRDGLKGRLTLGEGFLRLLQQSVRRPGAGR